MWNRVIVPFSQMLGSQLYPTLYDNSDYRSFLAHAGVRRPYPRDVSMLTQQQSKALSECAQVRANLLGLELQSLGTLKHAGARAIELEGPLHLYRLWDSKRPESEFKFFWFTEGLLRQSYKEAGPKKGERLAWLRGKLAVAYNWSGCDRIARLKLKPSDSIPAVEASGRPVRAIDNRPRNGGVVLPKDYFRQYETYSSSLLGGALQLYLFLLPDRVEKYWN